MSPIVFFDYLDYFADCISPMYLGYFYRLPRRRFMYFDDGFAEDRENLETIHRVHR